MKAVYLYKTGEEQSEFQRKPLTKLFSQQKSKFRNFNSRNDICIESYWTFLYYETQD